MLLAWGKNIDVAALKGMCFLLSAYFVVGILIYFFNDPA